MTVMVTGGAGFIGSALVRALVGDGMRVVTVDKLTYAGALDNLAGLLSHPEHVLVRADICDHEAIAAVLMRHHPSTIYHLAAESHVDRSIDSPAACIQTNIVGTAVLLGAALDYWVTLDAAARARFRFVQVSTDEVYGDLGPDGAFNEASPYRPNSPYSASKAGADHLARAWYRTYGLPVLVTNSSNNYGPCQFPEKLIPLVVLNALAGKELPVYGDGSNVRDWLYVDDHVTALRRIAEAGRVGETYLIGAHAQMCNLDLVRAICRLLDDRHPSGAPHGRLITFVADRPGHDRRYALDSGKIERELGWRPSWELSRGLAATVDWYIANQEWCRRANAYYGGERLGLGTRAA
jgi:dTDP-glucose 4,6-dehydratase